MEADTGVFCLGVNKSKDYINVQSWKKSKSKIKKSSKGFSMESSIPDLSEFPSATARDRALGYCCNCIADALKIS